MNKCVACEKTALLEHEVGGKIFCNACYLKLHMPLWENKTYNSATELESQEKKVLEILKKGNYTESGALEVLNIFEDKKNGGFIKSMDGGLGQIIELYNNHCTIITKNTFAQESLSEDYARIMKSITPQQNKTKENLKTLATKGLIRGGISVAANYAIDQEFPDKENFTFYEGAYEVFYSELSSAEILPSSNETNTRVMKLTYNSGNDIVFFYSALKSKKVTSIRQDISNGINNAKSGYGGHQEYMQSAMQPMMQSAMQPMMQSPTQPMMQSPTQPMMQSPIQPMMQSPTQPTVQSPAQPMMQSPTQPTMQSPQQISDEIVNGVIKQDNNLDSNIEIVRKYKALMDDGIISEEEFNKKKKELLGL